MGGPTGDDPSAVLYQAFGYPCSTITVEGTISGVGSRWVVDDVVVVGLPLPFPLLVKEEEDA